MKEKLWEKMQDKEEVASTRDILYTKGGEITEK